MGQLENVGLRRESLGFACGSSLFVLGAFPGYTSAVGSEADNLTYFAGSLFFTGAAFVQLRLSGRVVPTASTSRVDRYDWWSALVQFVGTLLFNVSTGAALVHSLSLREHHEFVWQPDVFGSLCFLVSSGLAVVATTDVDGLWDPHARNWISTWLNVTGSVAFGISAVGAVIVPGTHRPESAVAANLGTLVGALCFLIAALFMKPAAPGTVRIPGRHR
ncbi:YrhK-like protein [Rhodococcus sp. OK519]|uniref:YrhK family protein n=1 Tax=Rhodococcus sp. OK519 TaxID=2135729 RepID=UPI000D331A91|nr:YrhK-like protein [Rhodococcus sp. OK519]